jgi:hypothetical protein
MCCGQRITKNQEQKSYAGETSYKHHHKQYISAAKEIPNNVHTNKATYASVAASDFNQQKSHTLETADINRTLQLILNKITNLEGVFSKMNECVKKLESVTTKPATNSKHK